MHLHRRWLRSTICSLALLGALLPTGNGVLAQTKTAKATNASGTATAPASAPLDLNTATADQLKALPGIGDAYAKRIIDGRPYSAKNQLATRGVIPQNTYDKIKDSIVARRVAKP